MKAGVDKHEWLSIFSNAWFNSSCYHPPGQPPGFVQQYFPGVGDFVESLVPEVSHGGRGGEY